MLESRKVSTVHLYQRIHTLLKFTVSAFLQMAARFQFKVQLVSTRLLFAKLDSMAAAPNANQHMLTRFAKRLNLSLEHYRNLTRKERTL